LDLKHFISNIIEEELTETDHFLVSIESNETGTSFKFFIDGNNGVDIQVCGRLSRKISRLLDEEEYDDTPIRYEISSPGADRPLVDSRQYPQHVGRDLEVSLNDETIIDGELTEVDKEGITLSIEVSKHSKEVKKIMFNDINKSTVKISFKRKKK
jgi:ribosome maturation factor RimP